MAHSNPVPRLYETVVDDVISNVREAFLDEGVDEQVLQELKQLWKSKLDQSKAVEGISSPPSHLLSSKLLHQQQQSMQPMLLVGGRQTQQQSQGTSLQQPVTMFPISGANMTDAATAATMALPAHLYPQSHVQITLQQTSQGQIIAVPHGQLIQGRQVIGQPQAAVATAGNQIRGQLLTAAAMAGNQVRGQQPPPAHRQPVVTQTYAVPGTLQQKPPKQTAPVQQLDGTHDTSSSEDDDDDDDDKDDEEEAVEENGDQGEEEEPLNSADDISEEDPSEIFDTDNVVVCQYDKINRSKNKWKFHLKDGIMNLNGTDFVFQKANGDAEW